MPGPYPLFFPSINGHQFSFTSIEVWMGGIPLPNIAFKSINYKNKLTPGVMRGTRPHKLGRTRGEHDPTADCEIYRLAWENLRVTLGIGGVGYGETSFDILVQFAELPTSPVLTDRIVACRVTETDYSNQSGTDPSTVKLTLDPMDILENGYSSIVGPLVL